MQSPEQSLTPLAIAIDPLWLADRYDPMHDTVHFRAVARAQRDTAPFLTDAYLGTGTPVVVRRSEALAAPRVESSIHFIFHSAYCCSTLLARALDTPGVASTLKEPVILNDLVGWRWRGGTPAEVDAVLGDALALLARPFSPDEAVIVKPSNITVGLTTAMLEMRPAANALLLHAPLADYLLSIAKKGMAGRLWVRKLLSGLLKDSVVDLGFSPDDYLELTDLQAAAVGWLAQHAHFTSLVADYGLARVRTLDSVTFLKRPADTLNRLAHFFGLALSTSDVAEIALGPAFQGHSKSGERYGPQDRLAEQHRERTLHADELAKVETWAKAVAANIGLSLDLSAPLLEPS
jgi:hypothetical protein